MKATLSATLNQFPGTLWDHDDPIKAWETWRKFVLQIADKHAPIKKRRVRKVSAPWLTAETKDERVHFKTKKT
jgi:hypothetical protein